MVLIRGGQAEAMMAKSGLQKEAIALEALARWQRHIFQLKMFRIRYM